MNTEAVDVTDAWQLTRVPTGNDFAPCCVNIHDSLLSTLLALHVKPPCPAMTSYRVNAQSQQHYRDSSFSPAHTSSSEHTALNDFLDSASRVPPCCFV